MIALRAGEAVAEIVPERGAICSRLRLGGSEILYLDPATLSDPGKSVRGGIPVLFPIAGKPPPGSPLKQHGFARDLPWEATRAGADRLECRLRTGALEGYPWPCDALLEFELSDGALRIRFTLHNSGAERQPFQLGFHPYFHLQDKAAARIATSATRALDNRTGAEVAYRPPSFTQGEVDLHLLDHREAGAVLQRGAEAPVELRWSPEFSLLVLWTLPQREFVCVEPWTARSLLLAPGATRTFGFEISLWSP